MGACAFVQQLDFCRGTCGSGASLGRSRGLVLLPSATLLSSTPACPTQRGGCSRPSRAPGSALWQLCPPASCLSVPEGDGVRGSEPGAWVLTPGFRLTEAMRGSGGGLRGDLVSSPCGAAAGTGWAGQSLCLAHVPGPGLCTARPHGLLRCCGFGFGAGWAGSGLRREVGEPSGKGGARSPAAPLSALPAPSSPHCPSFLGTQR